MALALLTTAVFAAESPWSTEDERERVFESIIEVFERNYWDEGHLDWRQWAEQYREQALAAPSREAFDRVVARMVGAVRDDHSTWLGRSDHSNDGSPSLQPPMLGFSARLLVDRGLVVERVFPGTAAAAAGVRRGDLIVRIDDQPVASPDGGYGSWRLLREAAARSNVVLALKRGNLLIEAVLVPRPFELQAAQDAPQAEMLDDRVGYLYLPTFNRADIATEVHRLLRELQAQGLRELVLDLRGNPGGRLAELGLTLGAFLDGTWARAVSRGEVVWEGRYAVENEHGTAWLEEPNGRAVLARQVQNPARFTGPLAVLVDSRNSSAGELAALVLKASDRAIVVGEATAGNVEAVRGFDLPDGSVVMVAVANVEGPDGASFSGGVVPDFIARESLGELAQGYDAPLAEAVRALRGLPFTPNRYFGKSANY